MQRNRNLFFPFIGFFIASIILFFLGNTFVLQEHKAFLEQVTSPLRSFLYTSSRVFFSESKHVTKLKEENRKLLTALSHLRELEKENRALKDQFQATMPFASELIPAKIVGAPHYVPFIGSFEEIVIDKGTAEGVKIGQTVIVKNQLVGKVVKTTRNLSVVSFLTSDGFSLTAKVVPCASCGTNSQEVLGVIRGKGGEDIVLENVVLSEEIHKDDIIVTRGDIESTGVGILPDLLIGKIISIEKNSSSLFQSAKVKSTIDFSKLTTVFVVGK